MRFRELKKQKKTSFSKSKKPSVNYATYPDRIKAFIVDLFMIYAPILYLIAYVIMGSKEEFQSSNIAPLFGVTLYGLIYALLIAKFGQTPGKKAYLMKVVDDTSYEQISFLRALCRYVMFLFSATILLGLLTPLYRKDKKGLHDIICHTVEIAVKE